MISDKLVSLLHSFSHFQLNSFRKYLNSPFFNEKEHNIQLFELIHQHLTKNKTNKKNLEKKNVWKKIFGDAPYKDVQLRRLCSDLTKQAQSYLAFDQYQSNPLNESIFLLSALNKPNLKKHYLGVVRNARNMQEKHQIKGSNFHLNSYHIEFNSHEHLQKLGVNRKDLENLSNADFHLNCFYITQKLKMYCEALDYENKFSIQTDIHLFSNFMNQIENSSYLKEPSVKAYFLIVHTLLYPDDESYYRQLKDLLFNDGDLFSYEELQNHYNALMNYCIFVKINNGHANYYQELFICYQSALKRELIFENGDLDYIHYKNIITVGLHIKEFKWVESFIQECTNRLPKENQDNDLNYNLAKVYFHKEEYEKVIEQLREVEYKNLQYALGGKLMLLKTYYELNEEDPLDSLIDSFRIYLMRNQLLAKDVQQQYMNVLRFTKRLVAINAYDKTAIEKLKSQITSCKSLAAKKWLLEKVGQLTVSKG